MDELDADMVADFKEAFSVFDTAKEGSISAGSLRSLLYAQGGSPAPPACEGEDDEFLVLIHGAVGDIVGEEVSDETRISFPQFVQLMVNLAPPSFEDEVAGIHSVLSGGNDVIVAEDLERAEACLIPEGGGGGGGGGGGEDNPAKSSRQELEDAVRTVQGGGEDGITVSGLTALMTHQ